jgi:hypothetical protein
MPYRSHGFAKIIAADGAEPAHGITIGILGSEHSLTLLQDNRTLIAI